MSSQRKKALGVPGLSGKLFKPQTKLMKVPRSSMSSGAFLRQFLHEAKKKVLVSRLESDRGTHAN